LHIELNMENHEETMTVVMANYNHAAYLKQAIDSVRSQLYTNWGLIIMDDASTDNSVLVINDYTGDRRIRFFKHKINLGYIATLNELIRLADSDVIGILDSDDALAPEAIREAIELYRKNPNCGFAFSNFYYCNEKLETIKPGYSPGYILPRSLIFKNHVLAWRTFRRSLFFRVGGFDRDILYAEDQDLVYKFEEVAKIYYTDKSLYFYRQTPNSHTTDQRKGEIGKISLALAKYKAYKRRLGKKIPNFTSRQVSSCLLEAIPSCIKVRDWKKLKIYFAEAVKLSRFNIFGYFYLFFRLLKFPFYRTLRYFYPSISKFYNK
jgi:glycosyltransferase involved in cell wall biosynthesis